MSGKSEQHKQIVEHFDAIVEPLLYNADLHGSLDHSEILETVTPDTGIEPWGIPVETLFRYAPNGIKDAEHLILLLSLIIAEDGIKTTTANIREAISK